MTLPASSSPRDDANAPLSLRGSAVTLLSLSADGVVLGGQNLPDGVSADAFGVAVVEARLSDISRRSFGDLVRTVARVGGSARERFDLTHDAYFASFDAEVWQQQDGTVGVMLRDMTGEDSESSSVHALSLELAHRTKNVLSIVMSLATQTGRRMPTYDQFRNRFFGQVGALSTAHDMIAASAWYGADITTIFNTCIGAADTGIALSISPQAGSVTLKPNAVQNIAIILHELQTACGDDAGMTCDVALNAQGEVAVVWECTKCRHRDTLWIDMLCTHAPISLDGAGELAMAGDGFRYDLRIGLPQRA